MLGILENFHEIIERYVLKIRDTCYPLRRISKIHTQTYIYTCLEEGALTITRSGPPEKVSMRAYRSYGKGPHPRTDSETGPASNMLWRELATFAYSPVALHDISSWIYRETSQLKQRLLHKRVINSHLLPFFILNGALSAPLHLTISPRVTSEAGRNTREYNSYSLCLCE